MALLRRAASIVLFIILLSFVNATIPEKAILFVVTITNDSNATLENYFATNDFVTQSGDGNYSFELLNKEKKLLYRINADVVFHSIGMPYGWTVEQSKELLEETSSYEVLYLVFPYFSNASYFRIKKDDKVLLEEKISLCNYNGVCDEHENSLACSDCSASDAICIPDADGICDSDCLSGTDPDCEQQGSNKTEPQVASIADYLLFGSFLVVVIVLVYVIKKRFRR